MTKFTEPQNGLWARYPIKKDYPILSVILLLATFLRFNGLNEPGLWLDEVTYTIAAQKPIIDQITKPTETFLGDYLSGDPTLSAIPLSLFLKLGFSNFLARFPAALLGILSIALVYRLGYALFGNIVALVTALLLCFSSFHILYSQEARSYTQFVFFSMASFLFVYRATLHHKLRYWGLYTLCTWAGVSTHHLMIFTVAAQGIFLLIVCLRNILLQNFREEVIRISFKVVGYFLASLFIIFILRLPWLEDFTQRQCPGCGIGNPSYTLDLAGSLVRSFQAFAHTTPTIAIGLVILHWLGLTLALYRSSERGILLACWLMLSIFLTTFGLWWFISLFFHERYTIWGLPAFFLTAAYGLVSIGDFIGRLLSRNHEPVSRSLAKVAQLAAISLLFLPILVTSLNQAQQNPSLKQSWPLGKLQEAAQKIISEAKSNETIIGIGMPALFLQFYIEPTRQDLIYFDEKIFVERATTHTLPTELTGRWYVLHNPSYTAPNIPETWINSLDYREFHDIVVVHLPEACDIEVCLRDTETLLLEISEVNSGSRLAEHISGILAGLTHLPQ